MKKRQPKPDCSIGITNSISQSKMVDKKIQPLILILEKQLKKIAKEEGLHINGFFTIWSIK